jgi:hypothetical protein
MVGAALEAAVTGMEALVAAAMVEAGSEVEAMVEAGLEAAHGERAVRGGVAVARKMEETMNNVGEELLA